MAQQNRCWGGTEAGRARAETRRSCEAYAHGMHSTAGGRAVVQVVVLDAAPKRRTGMACYGMRRNALTCVPPGIFGCTGGKVVLSINGTETELELGHKMVLRPGAGRIWQRDQGEE